MKEIINETDNFKIPLIVSGNVNTMFYDDSTSQFKCNVNVSSHKGSGGSTSVILSGYETITKDVASTKAVTIVSGWDCTPRHLRCQVKVNISKSILKTRLCSTRPWKAKETKVSL